MNLSNVRVTLQVLCVIGQFSSFRLQFASGLLTLCAFLFTGNTLSYPDIAMKYQLVFWQKSQERFRQILRPPRVRVGYISSSYGSGMNGGLGKSSLKF